MRVYSNTAMSADGKIGTWRHDHVAIGSPEDLRHMSELRAGADAVLVGGQTFRNWPLPLVERPDHVTGEITGRRPIWNAVLTRRGLLDGASPGRVAARWPDPRVRLLVLGGPELDQDAHRRALGAEVLVREAPTAAWAIEELERRGCQRVLVEAGGDLLFQLLAAGLLHEVYLTICPLLIGGRGAPTPLDGEGLLAAEIRRLELADCRRVGDELFLRYIVGS